MQNNIIIAAFGSSRKAKTRSVYQWDYGLILRFTGLSLPEHYEVHFANQPGGLSKTALGDENGVEIINEYLTTGKSVYAWVYVHTGDSDGETVYMVTIPVIPRARPTDQPATPQQQTAISQALALLNGAIDGAQESADAASQSAADAAGSASSASVSATQANRSATQASSAAAGAASSASIAGQQASIATSKAEAAAASATAAADSAANAAGSASSAAQTLTDVNAAGAAQISAIDAEGERVLASIPDDYTELSYDVSDLETQSNHTERGFDIDKSAFGLGYKSAVNTAFVVGGINSSTGALQRTTLSRARTGYLYLNGAYRIRNLSNGRLSIQIARVTIGSGYTVPVAYTTDANVDYTFSSEYAYVIMAKDTQDETTMSSEALALCNDLIVVTSGTMSMDDIQPLSHKSNMFVGYIDGNANPTSGAINTNAEYKHTDYIPVKPGEKYSVTSDYCNICFYDYSKVFVSGVAINNGSYAAIGTRDNPYVVVTVPDKAAFVVFATYRGEYDRQIVTRLPGATPYPAVYDLSAQLIPERNIVRDKSACLYDANLEKLTMYPSTWLAGYTAANWTAGTGLRMTSGTVRPYMYTTMEKSKISAIFTMSANGEIRFGYDSSNSNIGDSTTDSMVVCVIDSSAKTITMKRWNWSGDMGATLASASFNFTLTNGHKYCVSIEKDGVYHTTARLYDCDCPGEVAVAEYKKTYGEADETVNGFCRAWGCGRFTVASGTVVLKRFSMWSTGNAHPKMYIVGDSFVEQAGRNRLCGWPQRLYDATNGDAFLSGRGGATAANVLKRLPFELNVCHSQYGIVEIGTNDSVGSSSDVSTFKTQVQTIISVLERENIIPVLVTIARRTDTDNLTFIQEVNPWICSLGYLYIDEALAMSTGDGVTQDPAKYQADGIHPSIAGGAAVYEWIAANLPELIY